MAQPGTRNFEPGTVVLIGFMGCGKSSVARALAARLNCDAIDTDALIERAARMPIAQIFETRGEEEFRKIETQQLTAALEYSGVVATGGGIVTRIENRALLKAARERGIFIVYLRASADELARRIRRQPGRRPLIDGEKTLNLPQTRMRVEALLKERAPLYEEVANLIVETGSPAPAAVARKIAAIISNRQP